MTMDPPPTPIANRSDTTGHPSDETRMSFGDHLDELRSCLIRGLLGMAVAIALTLALGTDMLAIICRPLLKAQMANGLQPSLQALAPAATFGAYLKVSLLGGLIVSFPWLLYQAWRFVASGLYRTERRFVRWLIGPSLLLFALGVSFLYFIVLPVILQFFISFNSRFGTTALTPPAMTELLTDAPQESEELAPPLAHLTLPMVEVDPQDPPDGQAWVNLSTRRLMIQTTEGVWSTALDPGPGSQIMQSQFAIDFYLSFVLLLALAFGIAFQTPIVVFFLAWSGLVTTTQMRGARRYVLLGTVAMAAVLTPPDVLSQLLLAGPIFLLFELGILVARIVERK